MVKAGGVLYAIGPSDIPLVKIGFTKTSVMRRMFELQIDNPYSLEILATKQVEENVSGVERQIHLLLHEFRYHGEWFKLMVDMPKLEILVEHAIGRLVALSLVIKRPQGRPRRP